MPATFSEGKRVIDMGVALPLTNQSVTVTVAGLGNIEFRFDNPGGAAGIDIQAVVGGATVTVHNVAGATLGAGLNTPVNFGVLNGKVVYLNLRWFDLTGVGPYLVYGFYQEP